MLLKLDNVTCGYKDNITSEKISFQIDSGEIISLLGPNGVGKTTLFKTILGFIKIREGQILLDDENIYSWSPTKLAKYVAYVPQAHMTSFPFSVIDVVVMGRTAHLNLFSAPSKADYKIADEILESLNMQYLRDQIYTKISGGERQMVLIARALAQEPKLLIMDEPTSNLDFGNQVKVLREILNLSKRGIGILMTTHFPDHAFLCSTEVALMQRNKIFTIGDVKDIITEKNLKSAYGVDVKIISTVTEDNAVLKSCIPLLN